MAVALVLGASAVSCSDDDKVPTPLPTTGGNMQASTYNSLSFTWSRVDGAIQYGYELAEATTPDVAVATGVTDKTEAAFTDLKPSTDYTLKVWAYAAMCSDNTSSTPVTLTARTADIVVLPTPVITVSQDVNDVTVAWDAIEDAENYTLTVTAADGTVVESTTTEDTQLTVSSLANGEYTFTVVANINRDGYANSKPGLYNYTFQKAHVELWRTEGTYSSSITGSSWEATIVAYADDTYEILGWYGVEGYNLTFLYDTANADEPFRLTGDYSYNPGTSTYTVPTGLTVDGPATVEVYPSDNLSFLSGDGDSGRVTIHVFNPSTNDYTNDVLSWEDASPIDFLIGSWTMNISCISGINDTFDFGQDDWSETIEITKVDDTTIEMPALWDVDTRVKAAVDIEAKTITIQPLTVYSWYTLESTTAGAVVGHIQADGTLLFDDWVLSYYGSWYVYNATATFTR